MMLGPCMDGEGLSTTNMKISSLSLPTDEFHLWLHCCCPVIVPPENLCPMVSTLQPNVMMQLTIENYVSVYGVN